MWLWVAGQLCGEGWHHVGEACLRINSSRESYDNAQHYCKNLGGNIASLLTDKQVNFVLEELQKYQLQDKVSGVKTNLIGSVTVLVKAIHYIPPLLSPHKVALYYIKKAKLQTCFVRLCISV